MSRPLRVGREGASSDGPRAAAPLARGLWALIVFSLTTAVLGAILLSQPLRGPGPEAYLHYTPAHEELLASYGGRFPIAPRLSGSGSRASDGGREGTEAPVALAFSGRGLSQRLRAEALIEQDLSEGLSPDARAAAGVRFLLGGALDRAIAALEAARLERPGDPRVLNDLAAAYLTSGLEGERPLYLLEGLKLAHQAAVATPNRAEPLFNLALALEAFHAPLAAREHWRKYLERDDGRSPWAQMARERLKVLDEPTAAETWVERRGKLRSLAEAGSSRVGDLVQSHPEQALEEVEGWLFEVWPKAVKSGDPAAATVLEAMEAVTDAFTPAQGRWLLEAAIEHARSSRPGMERQSLAQAYEDLGIGFRAVERLEVASAVPPLERAIPVFVSHRSPYVHRARLLMSICRYQSHAYRDAQFLAEAAQEGAQEVNDLKTIIGSLQVRGVIESIRLSYPATLAHYRSTLELTRSGGWASSEAAIHGLIAETLTSLGDHGSAWGHRFKALSGLNHISKSRIRVRIWNETVRDLAEEVPDVAAYFLGELISEARQSNLPLALAVALENRALVRTTIGDTGRALSDLKEAEQWARQLPDRSLADAVLANVLVRRGAILAAQRPRLALPILDRAHVLILGTGFEARLPLLLRARARIRARLESPDVAIDDLKAALEKIESAASEIPQPLERIHLARESREVYDELVDLLVQGGRADEALSASERSRWSLQMAGAPYSRRRIEAHDLPPQTAIVAYHTLPDRLLVWAIRRDRATLAEVAVPRPALESQVEALARSLQWNTETSQATEKLFRHLIEPVEAALDGATELVMVADGKLHRVPFAALRDSTSGRFLVQDFLLSRSPSVVDAIEASGRAAPTFGSTASTLALGNPASPPALGLPALPHSEQEARALGDRFPRSTVLIRGAASETAFRDLAPRTGILHLAAHIRTSAANPLLTNLVLAADDAADGLLLMKEILELDLSHVDLAVLAGCSSAGTGRDAHQLPASFLAAGAGVAIGGLWDLRDSSSAAIFDLYYEHLLRGMNVVEALRATQLTFVESEAPELNTPAIWAALEIFRGGSAVSSPLADPARADRAPPAPPPS